MPALKSFADATRSSGRSATKSITGKVLADVKKAVEASWDSIVFEADGKPVTHRVLFDTDEGEIELEFFPDVAPAHVRSFIGLVKAGFYDGLIFHRCIPGFMIQGGCSSGDGTGGPGYEVKQEFNATPHARGVLSMARAQDPNSAGSQFFLCVAESRFLDKQYTAFGRVIRGMEVADRIVARPRNAQDRPNKPVAIRKATASVV
jgi:peptidyl-prolyl cis-trans isomerase B (cyclophilin B)